MWEKKSKYVGVSITSNCEKYISHYYVLTKKIECTLAKKKCYQIIILNFDILLYTHRIAWTARRPWKTLEK